MNQYLIIIDPDKGQNKQGDRVKNQELNYTPNSDEWHLVPLDVSRLVIHRIYGAKELIGHTQVKNYGRNQFHAPIVPYPCPIRALTIGKEWISMVINGVRYLLSRWKCHRFTRDVADLRSGFSFAGVAQW